MPSGSERCGGWRLFSALGKLEERPGDLALPQARARWIVWLRCQCACVMSAIDRCEVQQQNHESDEQREQPERKQTMNNTTYN